MPIPFLLSAIQSTPTGLRGPGGNMWKLPTPLPVLQHFFVVAKPRPLGHSPDFHEAEAKLQKKTQWHQIRPTFARLEHAKAAVLKSLNSTDAKRGYRHAIEFLLGHISVQTTERYLGCKQRIRSAVNDRIGIEPNP